MSKKVIDLFGNKVVSNTGVKYSKLLEKFMTPFTNEFMNMEYMEDILEFSINAWNMANINIIMPNDDIEKNRGSVLQEDRESMDLLKKMMSHKEENYKVYTNFIVDFELKETKAGEEPILSVITQEEEAYLSNMVNVIEDDIMHSQENLEENYIDRSAIVIKPLQPFIDWHDNLYPDSKIEQSEVNDVNIYLIDNGIVDLEKFLKKKYDVFFTRVLNDWHTNKKEWPQKRNYKMFNLWFQVNVSNYILDLEKRPILKSE
ncbi:MAG: hypothetical protein ABJK28_01700 [Algibacter sp.]